MLIAVVPMFQPNKDSAIKVSHDEFAYVPALNMIRTLIPILGEKSP